EFADEIHLQVPMEQAYLIAPYVGGTKKAPPLSRIGSTKWRQTLAKAQNAAKDFAAELLRIQALRETCPGTSLKSIEPELEQALEHSFPYTETADQLKALEEIYRDMEKAHPMDRLLCGDVGFGKTEVALRAAFRAVINGYQVAVLVPTTILCQQHYLLFRERLEGLPVTVRPLSRLQTEAQQREILAELASGYADIVIGTHRLLSPDIEFHNLGLIIIDEEHRFGVEAKERLKRLRAQVDILTMTATPIPRTLYLALSGVKDVSTIMTPPGGRVPVETIVARRTPLVISEAIQREIQRGGQIYFLHNRIKSINHIAQFLKDLVPNLRIGIGHGQLPKKELEEVMLRFLNHDYDLLLCTTIIESGIDIPNVNTIIIDQAEQFGLAQLYQLRGRVGRFHRQAYAYFLIPSMHSLTGDARQRIHAIRQFTSLGSGFKLAMRDMEIRGCGNILGPEQSGHIAAIGLDLYCELLHRAIQKMKGLPDESPPATTIQTDFLSVGTTSPQAGTIQATIPPDYIPEIPLRIGTWRQLGQAKNLDELDNLHQEIRDRYGPLPTSLQLLFTYYRLKIIAAGKKITHIRIIRNHLWLMRGSHYIKRNDSAKIKLSATTPEAMLEEVIAIISELCPS
ncbi:MAG: DEAD/DEAH box helicase, partial [Lentisphaerae bacterium]